MLNAEFNSASNGASSKGSNLKGGGATVGDFHPILLVYIADIPLSNRLC